MVLRRIALFFAYIAYTLNLDQKLRFFDRRLQLQRRRQQGAGLFNMERRAGEGGGVFCRSPLGAASLLPSVTASLPEEFRKTIHSMEEENEMKIENVADLEREFPDLAAEHERLKALDALAMPGGGEEIIARAKYEEPKDARANAALTARVQDAAAVEPAIDPQVEKQMKQEEIVDLISKNINSMRGY